MAIDIFIRIDRLYFKGMVYPPIYLFLLILNLTDAARQETVSDVNVSKHPDLYLVLFKWRLVPGALESWNIP